MPLLLPATLCPMGLTWPIQRRLAPWFARSCQMLNPVNFVHSTFILWLPQASHCAVPHCPTLHTTQPPFGVAGRVAGIVCRAKPDGPRTTLPAAASDFPACCCLLPACWFLPPPCLLLPPSSLPAATFLLPACYCLALPPLLWHAHALDGCFWQLHEGVWPQDSSCHLELLFPHAAEVCCQLNPLTLKANILIRAIDVPDVNHFNCWLQRVDNGWHGWHTAERCDADNNDSNSNR